MIARHLVLCCTVVFGALWELALLLKGLVI